MATKEGGSVVILRLFPGGAPMVAWLVEETEPRRYFEGKRRMWPEGRPLCRALVEEHARSLLIEEDLNRLPSDAVVYEVVVYSDHRPDATFRMPPGLHVLRSKGETFINQVLPNRSDHSTFFPQADRFYGWTRRYPEMERLDLAAEEGWISAWCIAESRTLNAAGDGVVQEDIDLFNDFFDVALQRCIDLGFPGYLDHAAWFGQFVQPRSVADLVESWFPERFYRHRDCSPKNAGMTACDFFLLNGYTEIAPAGHPRAHCIGAFKLRPDAPFP